jgi:hypothetical protein
MQSNQSFTDELLPISGSQLYRANEHGDLPVDDPPPAEFPSERYAAWSATSIFNFVPFSSPAGR